MNTVTISLITREGQHVGYGEYTGHDGSSSGPRHVQFGQRVFERTASTNQRIPVYRELSPVPLERFRLMLDSYNDNQQPRGNQGK